MSSLRCAVIGVGYLGRFHAQKYAQLDSVELVGVCDDQQARAEEIAQELSCKPYFCFEDLIGRVDAVSIAVPTAYHYPIAKFFLERGVHVLLEKPMTATVAEADELIEIARNQQLVLQVGHLERFNPVLIAARKVIQNPLYIESHRLATFKPRGTDINVMLDLMIHDIDIIQSLIESPIQEIRANGAAILSDHPDIATARLQFSNACVANVVASRVSFQNERKMRIFQHDAYTFLDFHNKVISVHRKGEGEMFPGIPEIIREEQSIEAGDALRDEIHAFVDAIAQGKKPVVSGEDGRRALAVAIEITDLIKKQYEVAL